jgi:hypothetical protein
MSKSKSIRVLTAAMLAAALLAVSSIVTYGGKHGSSGPPVPTSTQCMDITVANGNYPVSNPCSGVSTQNWTFNSPSGAYNWPNGPFEYWIEPENNTGLCLYVTASSLAVTLSPCVNETQELFVWNGPQLQWVGDTAYCVNVTAMDGAAGDPISLYPCQSSDRSPLHIDACRALRVVEAVSV